MTIEPVFGGPRVTAIGSGKGGTGKTATAIGLARALVADGERVLLCDADLGLSNAVVHLGRDTGGDLAGVLSGKRPVRDAVVKIDERFDLLAGPAGSGALGNPSRETLERLAAAIRSARSYDRVLLDLGAGIDDAVLHLAAKADETVLVMTPDPAALTDAYAFAKLLLRRGAIHPAFVVNMAGSDQEAHRTADALINAARAFLEVEPEFLGGIPRDPHVVDAVRRQVDLFTLHPRSHAAVAIGAIARKLHRRIAAPANAVNVR